MSKDFKLHLIMQSCQILLCFTHPNENCIEAYRQMFTENICRILAYITMVIIPFAPAQELSKIGGLPSQNLISTNGLSWLVLD